MAEESFDPKKYLQQGAWRGMKLGLHRTEELLERLGRPQDSLRIVHVAGTNGKGSTCAFMASILQAAGYRTGLFTSPYILRFNERMQVNNTDISDAELYEVALAVRNAAEAMDEHPTAFERTTVAALLYFARAGCDMVVFEVGLGGRLDSTNVVNPLLCAITPISLDHTHILGDTIEAIAAEKAGIIKEGVPVVCAAQVKEAERVIRNRAQEVHAPVIMPRFERICAHAEGFHRVFSYDGIDVRLRLAGVYQPSNAVLAIEMARLLRVCGCDIPDAAIISGLETTFWRGRFEVVSESPAVIVDGGHNTEGARVLAASLREYFSRGSVNFAMSVLRDKNYRAMLGELVPTARRFFCFEQADNERALPAVSLAQSVCEVASYREISAELQFVRGNWRQSIAHNADRHQVSIDGQTRLEVYVCEGVEQAVCGARDAAALDGETGVACCFGSLYAIADVMKALGKG